MNPQKPTIGSTPQVEDSGKGSTLPEGNSLASGGQVRTSSTPSSPQSPTEQATAAVQQAASEATEQARAAGRKYAAEKKTKLAEEVSVFSGAIRKASGKLREEKHDSLASYADAAAEQLDHLCDSLQNKSVSQIVGDLQDFTRRRPEIVYGGLFLAGLAAMRFLKASKPSRAAMSAHGERSGRRERSTRGEQRVEQFRGAQQGTGTGYSQPVTESSYAHLRTPTSEDRPWSSATDASTLSTPQGSPGAGATGLETSSGLDPKPISNPSGASR